jgi:hypothetical protein
MIGSGDLRTWIGRFAWSSGRLTAESHTFGWAVSRGLVPNMERLLLIASGSGTGASDTWLCNLTTAAPFDVTADGTVDLVSNSANDDGVPAGTGAQIVRVWMVNSAGVEVIEDVVMNGVAAVNTVAANIRRVNRAEVIAAGSVGTNAGVITVGHSTIVSNLTRIVIGYGVNDGIFQTVPAGKRDWITDLNHWYGRNTAGETMALMLRSRTSTAAPWVLRAGSWWNCHTRHFDYPIEMPAGTEYGIVVRGTIQPEGAVLEGFRETL